VIDGSDEENYKKIKEFDKKFNIELKHFPHNIHHGPGMYYGFNYIKTEQIILLDSDLIILNKGWLEDMQNNLRPTSYGIGDIQKEYYMSVEYTRIVDNNNLRRGLRSLRIKNVTKHVKVLVNYLHPACALLNRDIILKYHRPIKGGAPLINAMKEIHLQRVDILQCAQWLTDDFHLHKGIYIQHGDDHEGMGTVKRTGGYNLE
jgi:glycosyltransferase involved in cell wall biosynthesis